MHFPVFVVLPQSKGIPSRKDVERFVDRVLTPHQYVERDLRGAEEPQVVQQGWWDWYRIGGSFEDPAHESREHRSDWRSFFRGEFANVGKVSTLLENWSTEATPVRIVLPDGAVFGEVARSEDEHTRWAEEARQILDRYRGHLYVVVDCHK